MKTTEQKINLQLNIDGYKFFETNQSFDDDQTYSNLIQGFMDDLDYKLENMGDSEDEPVDEELYDKIIPHKKPKLQISINIDIPEKEANSIISYIQFIYDRNSLVKDIYDMLNESSLNIQEHNFRKEAIDSQIHNMFKQVHLENQIHNSEFGAFKINGELLPSIKFKLIEDPIHDWFLIGAEDQIILLANNPLYETGQN